jgi:spermidine synthase
MELWFTEKQTPELGITCKVKDVLHTEKSQYQQIAVLDTYQFGRLLALDGIIQTTICDEFVYHEMIAHVPLFTHPNPKRVLVIGGGDGGAIREVLKHKSVEAAYLAEIDGRVVEVSKQYLPEISCALDDPRCHVEIGDGIKFVQEHKGEFDVIIVDSTDPIGPAVGLFHQEFYRSLYDALSDDGLFVAQTESPFYNAGLIRDIYRSISEVFPITRLYLAHVPTYPGGMWSFTIGSKGYDPIDVQIDIKGMNMRYYTPEVHKAAFVLPEFVKDIIKGGL